MNIPDSSNLFNKLIKITDTYGYHYYYLLHLISFTIHKTNYQFELGESPQSYITQSYTYTVTKVLTSIMWIFTLNQCYFRTFYSFTHTYRMRFLLENNIQWKCCSTYSVHDMLYHHTWILLDSHHKQYLFLVLCGCRRTRGFGSFYSHVYWCKKYVWHQRMTTHYFVIRTS